MLYVEGYTEVSKLAFALLTQLLDSKIIIVHPEAKVTVLAFSFCLPLFVLRVTIA